MISMHWPQRDAQWPAVYPLDGHGSSMRKQAMRAERFRHLGQDSEATNGPD